MSARTRIRTSRAIVCFPFHRSSIRQSDAPTTSTTTMALRHAFCLRVHVFMEIETSFPIFTKTRVKNYYSILNSALRSISRIALICRMHSLCVYYCSHLSHYIYINSRMYSIIKSCHFLLGLAGCGPLPLARGSRFGRDSGVRRRAERHNGAHSAQQPDPTEDLRSVWPRVPS